MLFLYHKSEYSRIFTVWRSLTLKGYNRFCGLICNYLCCAFSRVLPISYVLSQLCFLCLISEESIFILYVIREERRNVIKDKKTSYSIEMIVKRYLFETNTSEDDFDSKVILLYLIRIGIVAACLKALGQKR